VDTIELVDAQLSAGQALLHQLAEDGFPACAAFWAYPSEDGRWWLYLAFPELDKEGPTRFYDQIAAALDKLDSSHLSLFDIKAIGEKHPLTRSVLKLLAEHRPSAPFRYEGPRLGRLDIDGAVLYSPVQPKEAAPDRRLSIPDVVDTVARLLQRVGKAPVSTVTLEDGTHFKGVPFGIELDGDGLIVKFLISSSHSTRAVPASQIASIR